MVVLQFRDHVERRERPAHLVDNVFAGQPEHETSAPTPAGAPSARFSGRPEPHGDCSGSPCGKGDTTARSVRAYTPSVRWLRPSAPGRTYSHAWQGPSARRPRRAYARSTANNPAPTRGRAATRGPVPPRPPAAAFRRSP